MPAILEARSVSKRYGGTHVLRDVSFSVNAGSIVTLTGRSGSGKSTLFRLLAGLDRPTEGSVLVEGVDLTQLDDAAASELRLRRMGIVFQSLNLLPDLTAMQNVRLPLDLAGVPRQEATARAHALLESVHVSHLAERRPHLISGGEAQRVAIARALANEPAIILADEPTGSLDSENAQRVLDVFEEVNRERHVTVLVVTHDPVAMSRWRRQLRIEDGRLLAGGSLN